MSLATDGFSAMINVLPMALAGWVYQSRENARKFSFSSGGNVAEKTVEVKAGKFFVAAGRRLQVASWRWAASSSRNNPQPTTRNPHRFLYKSARLPDGWIGPGSDSLPQKIKHASDL